MRQSQKQQEQTRGYDRTVIIDEIVLNYRKKLEDLTREELHELIYKDREEQQQTWQSMNDRRMLAKWEKHEEYNKKWNN